ncbi:MAG: hypothetical protein ABI224_01965 [Acetobacteraceae bacterium]
MASSVRWVIRGVQGRIRCTFSWPIITARSVVIITAGEVNFGTTQARPHPGPGQDFFYVAGDADIWVSNICPRFNEFRAGDTGHVDFILHVGWDSPLDVAVTITVDDALPIEIQGYQN